MPKNSNLIKAENRAKSTANLRPAKKGEVRNPNGRPSDFLTKAMKKLTKEELEDLASLIIKGDIKQLKKISQDESQTVLRVMVASVCVKAIQKGDMEAVDKLLNRIIGKVKDQIHHSGELSTGPATVILNIPNNKRDGNF